MSASSTINNIYKTKKKKNQPKKTPKKTKPKETELPWLGFGECIAGEAHFWINVTCRGWSKVVLRWGCARGEGGWAKI